MLTKIYLDAGFLLTTNICWSSVIPYTFDLVYFTDSYLPFTLILFITNNATFNN